MIKLGVSMTITFWQIRFVLFQFPAKTQNPVFYHRLINVSFEVPNWGQCRGQILQRFFHLKLFQNWRVALLKSKLLICIALPTDSIPVSFKKQLNNERYFLFHFFLWNEIPVYAKSSYVSEITQGFNHHYNSSSHSLSSVARKLRYHFSCKSH